MTIPTQRRPEPDSPHAEVFEWIEAAQNGDRDAFGQIYARYHYHVLDYVTRRLPAYERDTAHDLTQDVFVRAMNSVDRYEYQGRDYISLLLTIARNIVIDRSRSLRHRVEVFDREDEVLDMHDPVDGVEQAVMSAADKAELLWHIKRLPEPQQRAIALVYFLGLSTFAAADAIGKSPEALKALTLRGRRTLAQTLPDHLLRS